MLVTRTCIHIALIHMRTHIRTLGIGAAITAATIEAIAIPATTAAGMAIAAAMGTAVLTAMDAVMAIAVLTAMDADMAIAEIMDIEEATGTVGVPVIVAGMPRVVGSPAVRADLRGPVDSDTQAVAAGADTDRRACG